MASGVAIIDICAGVGYPGEMESAVEPPATAPSAAAHDGAVIASIEAHLRAARLPLRRAFAVVVDLTGDPPLGRSADTLAAEEAPRLVVAAGAAMLVARARRGVIAVRSATAERALRAALEVALATAPKTGDDLVRGALRGAAHEVSLARGAPAGPAHLGAPRESGGGAEPARAAARAGTRPAGARSVAGSLLPPVAALTVVRVAAVWPPVGLDRDLGCDGAWVLDGEAALDLEAAALGRARGPRRLTVAGAVRSPTVLAWRGTCPTVEAAVEAAGGAVDPDWVALDGGLLGGALADREAPVRSSLLVVLPASHALVARARVPVDVWLRRAASTCEGCRLCSDACPVALAGGGLAPHALIAALASGRAAGAAVDAAARCVGCGICDLACPVALSPWALVAAARSRLRETSGPAGPAALAPPPASFHPDRSLRRIPLDLLLARLGLPCG